MWFQIMTDFFRKLVSENLYEHYRTYTLKHGLINERKKLRQFKDIVRFDSVDNEMVEKLCKNRMDTYENTCTTFSNLWHIQ